MALPQARIAQVDGAVALWTISSQRTFATVGLPMSSEWSAATVPELAKSKRSDGKTVDETGRPLYQEWILGLARHVRPKATAQVVGVGAPLDPADAARADVPGAVFVVTVDVGGRVGKRDGAGSDTAEEQTFPLGSGRRTRHQDEADLLETGEPLPVVTEAYIISTALGPITCSFAHPHPQAVGPLSQVFTLDAGEPLREVQVAARHADPRTTTVYDRRRQAFDKHAAYGVVAFVAGG